MTIEVMVFIIMIVSMLNLANNFCIGLGIDDGVDKIIKAMKDLNNE